MVILFSRNYNKPRSLSMWLNIFLVCKKICKKANDKKKTNKDYLNFQSLDMKKQI